jgi:acyl dehydratase
MTTLISKNQLMDYVGFECPPTTWHKITQEQINRFADVTLDHQFIHVDPEAAKATPFGGTIAHGFLTLSMLSHFAQQFSVVIDTVVMGINYGFDKVRFIAPVKVNKEIRAKATIANITEKTPGQVLIKYIVEIEINGEEKPAVFAEMYGLQIVK